MDDLFNLHTALLVLAAGVASFLTRVGGYVLITRMAAIPPRMEAALNAVPAAVLATLVAPTFFNGGWDVRIALLAALLVGLRFPGLPILLGGWLAVMIVRHGFGV